MRYAVVALALSGFVGCAWFGGDADKDRRTGRAEPVERVDGMDRDEAVKVGFARDEVRDDPRGDTAIDPVSGEVVSQERTRHTAVWKDLTYFFGSEDNREAFEDNPEAYVTEEGYLKKSPDAVRREAEVK